MATELFAQFDHPKTVASYLGETVGTHYSVALRAAEAYGKHLAAVRTSLLSERFEGDGLGNFWKEMMTSEQVRSSSPDVLDALRTTPSHYFSDFLDTADAVFRNRYEDVPQAQRKKVGQNQHVQCLRLLRDHKREGIEDHFAVQNRVAKWMQMIRALGAYQK